MMNFKNHIINADDTIINAMKMLDNVPDNLTLFVTDHHNKMVGTLTDGDVRRGFIKGNTLDMPVSAFMAANFRFIDESDLNIIKIKQYTDRGVKLIPVLNSYGEICKVYDFNRLKGIVPVECMIMAGGRGERLRPLTDSIPKPMLTLGSKPIIEHNIDRLISYGIEKIYISVKYLGEKIKTHFGDGSKKNIEITYIEEEKPLGTAGALSLVKQFNSNYIMLMNSDLFTDIDFESFYLTVLENDADMGVASIPYTIDVPYAIFENDNDFVLGLSEKPSYTKFANAGIYIFKKKWLKSIPTNEFFNITDLMALMVEQKAKIIHFPIIGYWIDIGKMDDYNKAKEIAKHFR